ASDAAPLSAEPVGDDEIETVSGEIDADGGETQTEKDDGVLAVEDGAQGDAIGAAAVHHDAPKPIAGDAAATHATAVDATSEAPKTAPESAAAPPPTLPFGTRIERVAPGDQEAVLFKDLLGGSFEAGERLVALYGERARDRAHDVLAIRKQQAALRPGDRP